VSRGYHWPCMKEDITHFVKAWVKCQVNQASYQKQTCLLQLMHIPPGPRHSMCMDFITSLLESQGYDVILVMVDWFAKLAHMVWIVEPVTPFFKGWWRYHGLPNVIVSYRDPKFTNVFWRHFPRKVGMKLRFSITFHSQTNGIQSVWMESQINT